VTFRFQKAHRLRLVIFDRLSKWQGPTLRLSGPSSSQVAGLSELGIPRDFVGLHTPCQDVPRVVAHGTDKTAEGASSTPY
jgi:hypothetical protein